MSTDEWQTVVFPELEKAIDLPCTERAFVAWMKSWSKASKNHRAQALKMFGCRMPEIIRMSREEVASFLREKFAEHGYRLRA